MDNIIGFLDGLSLTSECSSEVIEQNAMYSGYHSDTMVSNIFAYGPDGKVFLCAINFQIRDDIVLYKICVNQGFPRSGDAAGFLLAL
jgi:hypothetical protein